MKILLIALLCSFGLSANAKLPKDLKPYNDFILANVQSEFEQDEYNLTSSLEQIDKKSNKSLEMPVEILKSYSPASHGLREYSYKNLTNWNSANALKHIKKGMRSYPEPFYCSTFLDVLEADVQGIFDKLDKMCEKNVDALLKLVKSSLDKRMGVHFVLKSGKDWGQWADATLYIQSKEDPSYYYYMNFEFLHEI